MSAERDPMPIINAKSGPGRYLRNAWYVAGWADALGDEPQAKAFLEEPVALFRDGEGKAHAIAGRCPHRFAPLGHGKVVEGALQCPYHGLRFDGAGACVFNPHESGAVPCVSVPIYPLVERHNLLWIWMGQPARADEGAIPDFGWLADPKWEAVRGATLAEGHYELYSDNILDLSHANFIHPALVADAFTTGKRRFWTESDRVHVEYSQADDYLSEGIGAMTGKQGQKQDFVGEIVWHAPATLYFDFSIGDPGTPREAMTMLPSLHAFTPETADSTHYVWATARDYAVGDAEFSAVLRGILEAAFEHEDMPIIRDVHRLMAGADFWDLKPLILTGDGGGVRARRILARMIAEEEAGTQLAAE